MENLILNNNVSIPQIGFGVFRTQDGEETVNAVRWALEAGYRHIDTAKIYGNEASVGQGIRESGIDRKDIFLTTKLWNEDIRARNTRDAFMRSLDLLQTDYVDLYLIHWPAEGRDAAWSEMEKLYEEGRIRAIGVSNFQIHHLEELDKTLHIVPAVNQIESNPYFQNQQVIDYCRERGIVAEAWSPLGGSKTTSIRDDAVIAGIAADHGVTPTQVIIRWHLQRGIVVLPKSTHKERIFQNLDVFGFDLSGQEMKRIASLERGTRVGSDPDHFTF